MIGSAHRFHGAESLRRVYRIGRTVRGPVISLRYLASNDKSYRAAVVVSKKIHKSAVKRNRVRRRIYEVVRLAAPEFKGSHDFIISVFSNQVIDWSPAKLRKQIVDLLKKSGIVK